MLTSRTNVREDFGADDAFEAVGSIFEKVDEKGLAMSLVSVTLGSGLRTFAEQFLGEQSKAVVIPTREIPHFPIPRTAAAGHDGNLIITPIDGDPKETMAIWAGRVHFYQTILQRLQNGEVEKIADPEVKRAAVVFYIAIARVMGVSHILTSNAVGSVRPEKDKVGDIIRVSDHILDPDEDFGVPEDERWFADKAKQQRAAGKEYSYGNEDYFYSQANLYSPEVFELAQQVARDMGMPDLKEGVLHWRKGRGYESPAMIQAVHTKGAHLAAMSTAPEAQKARSIGFSNQPGGRHFASFSVVTNVAQLKHSQKLVHGEVAEAGNKVEATFNPFMLEIVKRIAAKARVAAAPQVTVDDVVVEL